MTTPFAISTASTADYPAFARLFLELGVPEAPPTAERFEQAILRDTIVLREGDAVLGYAWFRARGERVHVVHVVTDALHRSRGVGRALMAAVAERARASGFRSWMLNVKPENVAARALYERCGMRVALQSTSMRVTWADIARLPPSPIVSARVLAPTDDAHFEAALALSRGELAGFRAGMGRVVVGAEASGAPVGVVTFDPNLPSASPFRLRAPEYARPMLEALRPHALPEHDFLFAFVEDDPALEAALTAAGARAVLRVVRMEGAIPS